MISGIPSDEVEYVWREVEPYIQRALNEGQGEYTTNDILEALKRKDMQLWIGDDLLYVGVTQILTYPSGLKVVDIVLTAGYRMGEWVQEANDHILAWAKSLGADQVRVMGRPGWRKALKDYKHAYTVMIRRTS